MKKRDVLSSPQLSALKRKRRRSLQSKILFFIFLFGAIFTGLIFVSRLEKLNIKEVKISGNKILETNLLKETVENSLEDYYFYFFPKSNFFLFSKDKIRNELNNKFQRLKDISFKLESSNVLLISLSEREAKYLWCGENLPITDTPEENPCYFMDESGYIFDLAPYFSGDVYFRFFGPLNQNKIENPLGSRLFLNIFQKIISFKDFLLNVDIKPVSIQIKKDGDIEIYLSSNLPLEDTPKIILKSDFDLEKTSENLQAAITTDPLQSELKNNYSSLLYLDLRFGNKVYYKFK